MCGCTNNGNNSNQCTIILIIVIFALQGLLNGSSQSRTALILLFLFWLCGMGGRGSYAVNQNVANASYNNMQLPTCYAPVNPCYYAPVSMRSPNCGDYSCKKKDKHRKNSYCKCERVKVCLNNSAASPATANTGYGCGCGC